MTSIPPRPPPRPPKSKPSLNGLRHHSFEIDTDKTNTIQGFQPQTKDTNCFKVAIVGAGIAGLSAAHHLVIHGIKDIVILEARDRVGGRIHTITHDGKPLELGAQWIHGGCPANSVFNLANK